MAIQPEMTTSHFGDKATQGPEKGEIDVDDLKPAEPEPQPEKKKRGRPPKKTMSDFLEYAEKVNYPVSPLQSDKPDPLGLVKRIAEQEITPAEAIEELGDNLREDGNYL